MKDSQSKSRSESTLSKGLKSTPNQVTVKSLTGIKNAILSKKKVWITMDGENWVYVELRKKGSAWRVWINFGMDSETASFHVALTRIHDFLSFKRSTDLL